MDDPAGCIAGRTNADSDGTFAHLAMGKHPVPPAWEMQISPYTLVVGLLYIYLSARRNNRADRSTVIKNHANSRESRDCKTRMVTRQRLTSTIFIKSFVYARSLHKATFGFNGSSVYVSVVTSRIPHRKRTVSYRAALIATVSRYFNCLVASRVVISITCRPFSLVCN